MCDCDDVPELHPYNLTEFNQRMFAPGCCRSDNDPVKTGTIIEGVYSDGISRKFYLDENGVLFQVKFCATDKRDNFLYNG